MTCRGPDQPNNEARRREEGALCAGWLSQPAPAALQPLAPWTPYTEYVSHEAVSCPYSADMYVQPVCPSYTVVGPSSVLTYASQPLITNVTVRHTKAFTRMAPL